MRSESKRAAAIVTNVMMSVNRRHDSADALLFYRAKKIAGIFPSAQAGLCYWCCIKAALKGETGFFRCVIERTHNEILAVVTLGAPGQSFVLICQSLHDFRPWNVRANLQRPSGQNRDCSNQSPKTDSIGPPIRISIGSRFHSYS